MTGRITAHADRLAWACRGAFAAERARGSVTARASTTAAGGGGGGRRRRGKGPGPERVCRARSTCLSSTATASPPPSTIPPFSSPSPRGDGMATFSDGGLPTHTHHSKMSDFLSHSSNTGDMRHYLQTLLDTKEKQLQQAGALGQRVLAQQVELEERVRQLQEIDADKGEDVEIDADMRERYRQLAESVSTWEAENVQLSSAFGSKVCPSLPSLSLSFVLSLSLFASRFASFYSGTRSSFGPFWPCCAGPAVPAGLSAKKQTARSFLFASARLSPRRPFWSHRDRHGPFSMGSVGRWHTTPQSHLHCTAMRCDAMMTTITPPTCSRQAPTSSEDK